VLRKPPVILKNLLSVAFGQLLSGLLVLASVVVIARYLGANRFGDYSYIMAFVNIFQFIADLGIASIFVREVSRDHGRLGQFLGNLKALYWVFSFCSFIILIVGIRLSTGHPDVYWAAFPAAIATIALFHVFGYATVFRTFEEMEISSAGLVFYRLAFFLLVLLAIELDTGIMGILTALALSSVSLWGVYYGIVSRKYQRPRISFDWPTSRFMLKEGLSTGGTIILRKTLWYMDTFMLKTLSTSFAVGIFNSVYQIVQIFYLVPWALAIPFFPVFSRLSQTDPKQLHRMLKGLLKITWLITLPLSVWIAFTSHQIIQTIYGAKFSLAGDGLRVMIWTIPFLFPTSFFFSFSPPWANKRPILYASQLPWS